MKITRALVTIVFIGAFLYTALGSGIGKNLPNPYEISFTQPVTDTIPIKDNYGDHLTDPNKNPFDITSSVIQQKVEYDPETGQYIVFEKIGDEYYRTPTYLTFEEYLAFQKKQQEREYFNRLAGITTKKKGTNSLVDPMERIDVQNTLVDRLFGGTEVNIQPQGQVDVTLQSTYYNSFIPPVGGRAGSSVIFNPIDPDVDISVSVDGNIGTKMNLAFNYDTQSTFDFDRKIKLEYDTEAFGEDDIIKKIEAGNVSLPLRGSLIQGAQSLFGLKTELQFGHLRLTAIASQQQSEQNNLRIENGTAVQEFELTPDQYDENRHFFLSHYNRATFEKNLSRLPQINTSFRISQLEVWISEDRPTYQNRSAPIVALSDLAEPDIEKYTGTDVGFQMNYSPTIDTDPILEGILSDSNGEFYLPDNRANPLYDLLIENDEIEDLDKVANILAGEGLVQNRDFEVFNGRKLSTSEYSFNEQLGFISLNIRLRPNQVMAVAYNYNYTANCEEIYNVGNLAISGSQFSSLTVNPDNKGQSEADPPKVLFTKLIKSTQQRTDLPSWDLMMKNVYPLRASQLDPTEFKFDIFYEDDSDGSLKKFIPEPGFEYLPLLQIFNLDRLNKYNDPQSDGVFDFVPGVTIIPSSGSVVFPVLEPFGSSLDSLLGPAAEKYRYQELYDTSITIARQSLEKNKFLIAGEVKSATSGEINLGPFVPEGSVRVTAGGIQLVEGADYEVDYSIGRLRIINDSYLQQGTPINVSFEDQALFSLQQKTMLGLRADYEFNDNFSIGATYLRLFERPFTEKVNIGNDPINNRIFGLDLAYSNEAPLLTKMVDKLPFYSTKEASSINISAEAAYLKPGHSGAINIDGEEDGGVVSIDDFEGAISGLLLGGFNTNQWRLASTPTDQEFPEAVLNDDLLYGVNRARTNWYVIDRQARSQADFNTPYTRLIDQTELFNREVQIGQSELITFDVGYYPSERGPYNFDLPGGTDYSAGIIPGPNGEIILDEPETRWGGIMRNFQNTDFEAANYEFIEFWMLNPYMDRPDGSEHDPMEEGEIIFHLGNVSEDIIKDGLQFYENSVPIDSESVIPIKTTNWGKVPLTIPVANGFDIERGKDQDIGYDGLRDDEEREKYEDYISILNGNNFTPDVLLDPSGDNYNFVEADQSTDDLLTRYKDFNNPEGNAPIGDQGNSRFQRGNRYPESEDLNNNKSLDQGEGYYKYVVKLKNLGGELDRSADTRKFITQDTTVTSPSGEKEIWYRFRIPITSGYQESKNISGFRAIQFMRMYMTKFSTAKTFRLADFQLVRNLWRKGDASCSGIDVPPDQIEFSVDEVGVEENGQKEPFGYITPRGIKQERLFSTFSNLLQDEKSLSLNFCELQDGCEAGINKLARLDLTLYDKLQLFLHAEAVPGTEIPDGELFAYIRFGKDLEQHYYEYEIPLKLSDPNLGKTSQNIWPDTNMVDVEFEHFKLAKKFRIENNISLTDTTIIQDPDRADAFIKVVGTPSLGYIKVFEIGVRNKLEDELKGPLCGAVWINELRATGLNEDGGLAAQARMQIQMADLGDVNVAANYSSIGWGALDQRLAERNREELLQYDIATNLQLGKFFPTDWGINLPFYAQYSSNNAYRQFEPFERDLTVDEKVESLNILKSGSDPSEVQAIDEEIQEVKDRSKESTTIKTFNFTNVKKDGKGGKPWSISNFSASYSYTETNKTDPIIKEDKTKEYAATLDYTYSNKSKPIQPFKKIKSKALRIIKEFNFNLLPKSFSFSTNMNRLTNTRVFRLPQTPVFQFDDRRFLWDRNYGLNWDFTKNLKFNFRAQSSSIVDELRQVGIADDPDDRPWVNERGDTINVNNLSQVDEYRNNNLRQLGRNKNYKHNFGVQYNLPIRYLPLMDWVSIKADYKADYGWTAGALILIDDIESSYGANGTPLGNIIQNSQSRSLNGTFSFDKLYNKSKYLKKIDRGNRKTRSSRKRTTRSRSKNSTKGGKDSKEEEKKEREVTTVERILLRPLLSLRSIKATYKESFNTMIPGFMNEAELLGLSSGFSSPGFGFAAGAQPKLESWLLENQDWFNPSPAFNDQISQSRQQNIDLRIALEPFKDFDIDIDFKKTYRRDHTEVFRNKEKDFDNIKYMSQAGYDIGSFEVSNMGLNTLFSDNIELYNTFKDYRVLVSNSLPGPDGIHSEEWDEYKLGYGPNNYDVAIPAFMAAYLNQDPMSVSRAITEDVSNLSYLPKPNWTVRYDGLSKMEMFRDIFTSFTLNHSYKGSMQVNRFNSTLEFKEDEPFNTSPINDNYFSRIQIPAIVISDQFSPLIGLSVKTKSDMTFEAEWRKSRQLGLSLEDLREQSSSEIRFGFGYTIKNFRSKKNNKRKRRRGQKDEADDDKNSGGLAGGGRNSRGGVNNNRGKTLTINFDFSILDNIELIYEVAQGIDPQINSGQRVIQIAPSVDYDVNENLTMRFFFDYNDSRSKATVSNSNRRLNMRGGVTAQLKIN
ncbi:MAG: cell surface protein SprA [Saprospiraceae bacterium]|nr:cell surface protein SprA [Saprospiraceae bacterium]